MHSSYLRAFSLLDVLIALLIVSFLMTGGLLLGRRYLIQFSWDQLIQAIEEQFFMINVYALAGVSLGEDIATPEELPEMHHLYFQLGDEDVVWYIETRQQEGSVSINNRVILYEELLGVDLSYMRIKSIELYEDEESLVPVVTGNAVIITWTGPLAEISFHFLGSGITEGDHLSPEFTLPDEPKQCRDNTDKCFLKVAFEDISGNVKFFSFDRQKGIYWDPY